MKSRVCSLIFIVLSVAIAGCYVGGRRSLYDYDWHVYYEGNNARRSSARSYECPALDLACNEEVGRQRGITRALGERVKSTTARAEQKAYCAAGGLECQGGGASVQGQEELIDRDKLAILASLFDTVGATEDERVVFERILGGSENRGEMTFKDVEHLQDLRDRFHPAGKKDIADTEPLDRLIALVERATAEKRGY
jgi:hypothetical protein